MKYAPFKKRVIAGVVDCFFLSIIMFAVSILILGFLLKENVNQQMAPFVVITMLITPLSTLLNFLKHPIAYGNTTPYYSLFIVFFFLEILYYTIQEICGDRKTLGFKISGIEIVYSNTNNRLSKIILRSILKTISRYLYGIPLLTMFLSKKKQTIYDIITTATLVDKY